MSGVRATSAKAIAVIFVRAYSVPTSILLQGFWPLVLKPGAIEPDQEISGISNIWSVSRIDLITHPTSGKVNNIPHAKASTIDSAACRRTHSTHPRRSPLHKRMSCKKQLVIVAYHNAFHPIRSGGCLGPASAGVGRGGLL